MGWLLKPIRNYPVTAFGIFACALGWMFVINNVLHARPADGQFPLGPIMAAGLVSAVMGRAGLKTWWRELSRWRTDARWWLIALLAPALLMATAVGINTLLGAPRPTGAQLAGWTDLPGNLVGIFIGIGIGEEAGWTAFASPRSSTVTGSSPLT